MQSDAERFPSAPQAAILLLVHFLVQYVMGALLYDLRHSLGLASAQLGALAMVLASGLILASAMHYRRMTYRDLVHPSSSSVFAASVVLVPPVLLLVPLVLLLDETLMSILHQLFHLSAWEEQAFSDMVASGLPALLATCVLAPVLEEMLFRGLILRSFLGQYPRWAAISFSALFFGAAHLNIYQFLLAFCLGLLLGWLFDRSRSLIPCIALHGALNLAVFLSSQDRPAGSDSLFDQAGVLGWSLAGACACVGLLVLHRIFGFSMKRGEKAA